MKYLSLFSGIGGFELGIEKAYEDIRELLQSQTTESIREDSSDTESRQNGATSISPSNNKNESNNEHAHISEESEQEERTQGREWTPDKHRTLLHDRDRTTPLCIGYSEVNKYASQVYQSHYNHKAYGDITKINATELPDFDLLVGGFPCQAFSIAGQRRGFDDTRGTLFFDVARILKEKRPRNFVLENVKGLLSHDNGRTFKVIISTLVELGYCVEWQVLNAKNFGVPQNRERVFIVGHLGDRPRREVFPITGGDRQIGKDIKVVGTLETDGWEKRHE